MILTYALFNSPFSEDYILNLLDYYTIQGLRPCDKVRYCPANLRIETAFTSLQGTGSSAQQNPDNPDCWDITCFIGHHSFCVSDITPDIINPEDIEAIPICFPVGWKVYQLILWYDDLMQIPEFAAPGNTLRSFLDIVMSNAELSEKAICADVAFCKTDLSFLYSNIQTVNCDPILLTCGNPGTGTGATFAEVCVIDPSFQTVGWCRGEDVYGCTTATPVFFSTELVNLQPTNPGTPAGGDIGIIYQVTPANGNNTTFINIGESISDGKTIPKGLFSSQSGTLYNDFTHLGQTISISELPDVIHLIDDWDEEKLLYVETISDSLQYNVAQEGLFGKWEKAISSEDYLEILSLSKRSDVIFLGGAFSGALYYNDLLLTTSASYSGFTLKISSTGNLLDYHIVEKLNPDSKLFISENQGNISMIGKPLSGQVVADGTTVTLNNTNNLANFSFSSTGEVTFSEKVTLNPNIQMIKHFEGSGEEIFVTRGVGDIKLDQQEIYNDPQEDNIMIFTLQNGELLKHLNIIRFSGNVSEDVIVAYGDNNDIFVSLAFEGTVGVADTTFNSAGGKDILILKFDETGVLEKYLTFGSSEDENIMKMMYDSGILYFGGEFLGALPERTIGRHHFYNPGNVTQMAYVSYVLEEDFLPYTGNMSSQAMKPWNTGSVPKIESKRSNAKPLCFVEVFPNPVDNDLFVKINSNDLSEFDIIIRNSLGSIVWHTKAIIEGEQIIKVQRMAHLPSGLYLVEVQNEKGDAWNFKQIKN